MIFKRLFENLDAFIYFRIWGPYKEFGEFGFTLFTQHPQVEQLTLKEVDIGCRS